MDVLNKLKEYKTKEQNFRNNYANKVIEDFKQCIPDSLKELFEFTNVRINGTLLSASVKVGDIYFFMFYDYDNRCYECVFDLSEGKTGIWTSEQTFEALVDYILYLMAKI